MSKIKGNGNVMSEDIDKFNSFDELANEQIDPNSDNRIIKPSNRVKKLRQTEDDLYR